MKKGSKIVLYSSTAYDFDEVKKDICECNDIDPNEISDNSVWDSISWYLQDDFAQLKHLLNKVGSRWILGGNNRTWRGTGYGYIQTDDLANKICELGDEFEIYTENGHLYINAWHHDGGCCVEAKLLTYNGESKYDNWNYCHLWDSKSEYEVLDTLFNSNFYTKLPHIEKVW